MGETTKASALLLTRAEPQSAEFLDLLRSALDLRPESVISPLARTVPTGAAIPRGAAILTSGRAVEAAGSALAGRIAFCVGDRTADLARIGGALAQSAAGDAEALFRLVLTARPDRAVHLRGGDTTGDLAARLTAAGIPTAEVVVYQSVPQPPSAAMLDLLASGRPILAPVFSPQSSRRLAVAAGPALPRLHVAAISQAAAHPLAGAAHIAVADRPDTAAMRDLVLRLWRALP